MIYKTPPAGFTQKKLTYGPYSPSRLIAARCPSSFFAQYVRKDKVVGHTLASARGSAIHEVLAKITASIQSGSLLTTRQVSEWVSEAVTAFPAAYPQIDLIKEAADAYVGNPSPYINANTSCEKAYGFQLWQEDSFFDDAEPNYALVEVPYILEDGTTNPDCFFGGKLDQISIDESIKTITILDHKSTPSANENEEHTFQVGAYGWLVSLWYPGYTIKTVIHYAHPKLNFYSSPKVWSREELAEHGNYVLMQVKTLDGLSEFPAIPGTRCDYCHIVQECTLYSKVRDQKARGSVDLNARTFDDLMRLAKELHVVTAMASELRTALKNGIEVLCPQNGVDIGGVWYGFKPQSESVDWQATDVKVREEARRARGILEEGNYKPEDKVELERIASYQNLDGLFQKYGLMTNVFKDYSGQKLKNLWRLDKPELFAELGKFVVKDKNTKFGAHKS